MTTQVGSKPAVGCFPVSTPGQAGEVIFLAKGQLRLDWSMMISYDLAVFLICP